MAAVVGSKYCNANTTDIGVVTSVLPIGQNLFIVTNTNNNIIFRVDDISTSFHTQQVLLDPNRTPIITFRHKGMSAHHRWQVFRGNSTYKKDLIFNAKQSSMLHSNADTHVYLANNKDEKLSDYKVDSSFTFCAGGSNNNIIAKAKEHMVKVCPNVDVAFIVSLIVILDGVREVKAENRKIGAALLKGGAKAGRAFE